MENSASGRSIARMAGSPMRGPDLPDYGAHEISIGGRDGSAVTLAERDPVVEPDRAEDPEQALREVRIFPAQVNQRGGGDGVKQRSGIDRSAS